MTEKLINTEELCKVLGVSPMTISRLRKNGLPFIKIGNSVRFNPEKIKEWMDSREEVAGGDA